MKVNLKQKRFQPINDSNKDESKGDITTENKKDIKEDTKDNEVSNQKE